jgi:hypothetical protein
MSGSSSSSISNKEPEILDSNFGATGTLTAATPAVVLPFFESGVGSAPASWAPDALFLFLVAATLAVTGSCFQQVVHACPFFPHFKQTSAFCRSASILAGIPVVQWGQRGVPHEGKVVL